MTNRESLLFIFSSFQTIGFTHLYFRPVAKRQKLLNPHRAIATSETSPGGNVDIFGLGSEGNRTCFCHKADY